MTLRVGLFVLSLLATPAAVEATDPVAEIQMLRAQSNRDIARHDIAAWRRVVADGYTILPGSSGAPFDVASFERRIAPTFADPAFVTYERTPARIIIADRGKRAAETGRWVGTWRSAGRVTRLSGIYQATWVPTPAGWRIKNESFVSLRCAGDRCADYF